MSKNAEFLAFAEQVLETVEADGSEAVARLDDARVEVVARLGENIEIAGAARMEAGDGELVAEYVHPPADKIGVLVRARGGDPVEARRLAMHIAFAAPRYRTRDEVPAEVVAEERDVYAKQPEVQAKPEGVREKIVDGMLQKRFFAESVLADQVWIHDTSLTVARALEQAGLDIVEFQRFALAE